VIVEAQGVAVGRGAAPCLRGIDVAVRAGERIALVGGNGAGKTSLARVLAGLDRPRAGSVRWKGGALLRGPARPRTVGVLLQGEAPAPFAVRELVALGLGLDGPPSISGWRAVDAALARHELTPLAQRPCASLSGGEAQRAALARALVAGPELVILDEPTNHLDPRRRAEVMAWLDGLGATAAIVATHDLELAARASRVILLGDGGVAFDGPASDALEPARLGRALGVAIRRVDDPTGGPPLLRVEVPTRAARLP
jgi:iron complex transport system ATP-binding protein